MPHALPDALGNAEARVDTVTEAVKEGARELDGVPLAHADTDAGRCADREAEAERDSDTVRKRCQWRWGTRWGTGWPWHWRRMKSRRCAPPRVERKVLGDGVALALRHAAAVALGALTTTAKLR